MSVKSGSWKGLWAGLFGGGGIGWEKRCGEVSIIKSAGWQLFSAGGCQFIWCALQASPPTGAQAWGQCSWWCIGCSH